MFEQSGWASASDLIARAENIQERWDRQKQMRFERVAKEGHASEASRSMPFLKRKELTSIPGEEIG